jgi:signal transduction histidine kinase
VTSALRNGSLWARAGTVRVRTTLAAVLIVGVAVAFGGVALVVAMRQQLTSDARDTAQLRAHDVASSLTAGTPAASLTATNDDELLVRIVSGDGHTIAQSEAFGDDDIAVPPGKTRTVSIGGDRYVASAVTVETDAGARTSIAARSLEPVSEATDVVARLLLVGLPLLLLVVGVTTWFLAGRALAPVEAMRAQVAAISATALDRRVAQPPGRDEIAQLATTMNDMLARLEHAQQRQRQFVSDASHELRSPVAAIREQAEVAAAHPEHTTVPELADHVLAEDLRLQHLVEDLLVLARSDESSLRLARRPLDLDDIVFEEVRRLRALNGMQVDSTGVGPVRVLGDQAALRRAVANVAENATRHARTRVEFALSEQSGFAALDITDDGAGIPPGDEARVFERFVRLDDARARDAGGSGLGLAIVAQVVAAHAGTVRAVSPSTGGTRVEIRIPSAADPAT